jgi:hypothetical protein
MRHGNEIEDNNVRKRAVLSASEKLYLPSWCKIAEGDSFEDLLSYSLVHTGDRGEIAYATMQQVGRGET